MKSSYLVNLALVLLILALVWFNQQDSAQQASVETVSDVQVDGINTITIIGGSEKQVELRKIDAYWFIQSPIKARANKTRVEHLLSLLTSPVVSSLAVTPQTDLTQFAINDDSTKLVLNQLEFTFGSTEPLNKGRYVLHHNTLYLIDDRIAPLLQASSHSFIDNQLLSQDQSIEQLRLPTLDNNNDISSKFIEIKQQGGDWSSNQKQSTEQLQKLLDSWQYAQALQVIPAARLNLSTDKSHPLQIRFVGQTEVSNYQIHATDKALFIIDDQQQLAYQFVPELKQQLLLHDDNH